MTGHLSWAWGRLQPPQTGHPLHFKFKKKNVFWGHFEKRKKKKRSEWLNYNNLKILGSQVLRFKH